VHEIRSWFDGPLVLSGAIATGRSILAAQAIGADLAYIGSPFIATTEANAPYAYKRAIVDGAASDIIYSNFFSGIHGNYLRPSIVAAGLDPDNLSTGDKKSMNFTDDKGDNESKAWRDIWGSGQGIAAITSIEPAGERIARLHDEYHAACRHLAAQLA
jgi:nitronate monooxygenase